MNHKTFKTKGFTLLELIVAIALFMIFSAGLSGTAISGYLTTLENARMAKANAYFSESWEAVKSIRNNDWLDIANGTYGLSFAEGHWSFSDNPDAYEGFTRTITIDNVLRDDSGHIVEAGADPDPDTKRITIEIRWEASDGQERFMSTSSYLSNYSNPAEWPTPPPEPPPES